MANDKFRFFITIYGQEDGIHKKIYTSLIKLCYDFKININTTKYSLYKHGFYSCLSKDKELSYKIEKVEYIENKRT